MSGIRTVAVTPEQVFVAARGNVNFSAPAHRFQVRSRRQLPKPH
jgi:hypothetical protein